MLGKFSQILLPRIRLGCGGLAVVKAMDRRVCEAMGNSEARGASKALNHVQVSKYKVCNQIQVSQRQLIKSARARSVVPERGKQALRMQIDWGGGELLGDFLECLIY